MEIILMVFLVLATLAAIVAIVVQLNAGRVNDLHRQREHIRRAEREVNDIGQRAQDAILNELSRRTASRRGVVDGEVVSVREEPDGRRYW